MYNRQFKASQKPPSQAYLTEIETIGQQFDQVLKFLNDTILEHSADCLSQSTVANNIPLNKLATSNLSSLELTSISPFSLSLSTTPNSALNEPDLVNSNVSTRIRTSDSNNSNTIKAGSASDNSSNNSSSGIGDDYYSNESTSSIPNLQQQKHNRANLMDHKLPRKDSADICCDNYSDSSPLSISMKSSVYIFTFNSLLG